MLIMFRGGFVSKETGGGVCIALFLNKSSLTDGFLKYKLKNGMTVE